MKVTIAIAMYNVAEYIQECVESALGQEFDDYEVLVCDDCSTDKGVEIVNEVAEEAIQTGKLRIVRHSENRGVACTRNTAIEEARGEYIFFLDGDDCIPTCALSLLYEEMLRTSADVVMGNFKWWNGQRQGESDFCQSYYFKAGVVQSEFAMVPWLRRNQTDFFPVALWGKLYRRKWLINNKLFCNPSHTLVEDIFFSFKMSLHVKKIATISDVTYLWRVRKDSATQRSVSESYAKQYLDVYDACLEELEDFKSSHPNCELPQEIYLMLTNRYLGNLCLSRMMRSNNMSVKAKKDYVNHLSSITHIGIKAQSLSFKRRALYYAMRSRLRFWLIMLLVKLH